MVCIYQNSSKKIPYFTTNISLTIISISQIEHKHVFLSMHSAIFTWKSYFSNMCKLAKCHTSNFHLPTANTAALKKSLICCVVLKAIPFLGQIFFYFDHRISLHLHSLNSRGLLVMGFSPARCRKTTQDWEVVGYI